MYDNVPAWGWVIGLLVGIVVVGGGMWYLFRRFPPKSEDETETETPAPASSPTPRPSIADIIMSRVLGAAGPIDEGVEQVPHQVSEPVPVSAKPNTDDTRGVPGATGASPHDTAARDIIRASLIAELLDAGIITNRDKAICQAFKCSKAASTRPDAPFQVALRLVEQHRARQRPEYVGEMIGRVQREVEAEAH